MPPRTRDWFAQAERDLEQAVASRAEGRHEWACFAAHQAAEKAMKAAHYARGQEAWGHVVRQLLEDFAAPSELIDKGRVLDSYYIPTRYPTGHVEGAPFEHYGSLQSTDAITYAGQIIEFARLHVAKA